MPRYDHRCGECGAVVEAWAPVDRHTAECPRCGGIAVRIFPQRVNFKVWYQNFSSDCRDELRQMDQETRAVETRHQYQGFTPKSCVSSTQGQ